MRKFVLTCWILLFAVFSLTAAGKKAQRGKSSPSFSKRATLIIGLPIDASSVQKEKNEWFSGLSEYYLHFRLGASNSLDIIPSEKIHHATGQTKSSSQKNSISYAPISREFGATHILHHSYEISPNGKKIHYYAEITNTSGTSPLATFEKNVDLQSVTSVLDSCVQWFYRTAGISINQKLLSRFFNLTIFSKDLKEMKTIGKIVSRRYISTQQEINTSTQALLASSERDPHNLLAQYIAARLYESSGKFEKAIEQLNNLLIIIPNYASLYADVCRNYRLCEKNSEALSYAGHAEKKGIVTRALLLEGAMALEAMKKYTKAGKAFKIVLAADSTETNALLFFARQNNRQGNPNKAVTYADKIIQANPNNGEAFFEKGKALFQLKRYTEAEEALTKSAGLIQNTSEPTILIGKIHAISNDYNKAALFYEAAQKNSPDDFQLVLKTVKTWEKAEKPDRALKVLQRAENIFPDSLIIQKMLGVYYYRTADTTNAVFHLEQFLERGKKEDADVLITLGDIYTNKGKYDKAFYMYNHATPLLADKTKSAFSLALLYLKKGDTGAAISNLKKILKKRPDYPNGYRYLGDTWFIVENLSTALKEYKKARFYNKEDRYIQKRIALIYFMLKEYNAATREYLTLLKKEKDDAEAFFNLSISYLNLNKIKLAEQNLATALSLGKPNSTILYNLGLAYAKILDTKKSIEYFQKCVTLDPKHEKALLKLSETYIKKNNKRDAVKIYLDLYELDHSRHYHFYAKAGFLYEELHDTANAYSIFTTFVKNGYKNPKLRIQLARIEYSRNKFPAVIKLLDKIPEKEMSEKEDMLILADSYCSLGKPQEAIPWLVKFVSRNNKHKTALVMLAVSYDKTSDYSNALKIYKKVLTIVPDIEKSTYTFQIGLLYEKNGNDEEAIKIYRKNIDTYPEDIRNYNQLANLHSKLEDWGAVREILEKTVKLTDAKPYYWKKLAEVCLRQNDKAGTVKNYKKYLESNPKDEEAWLQLGDLYFNRGVFSKALGFYKKANKLKPNNFDILYKSAVTLHNTGDNSTAIKLFKKAHVIDSSNSDVLNYLALCYRSQNDADNLSETLRKLARLQPDNYEARVELGCTLLGQGNTQQAVANLEEASKMNPGDAETHVILSGIYASTGNKNARYSHMQKALTADPDNADVQSMMGKFYLEQNKDKIALKHIKKALTLNADHTEALHGYSEYLYKHGKARKALTYIKQAVKNDGYNPVYLMLYAKINHALNKNNLALKTIENALTLDSTNADILSCAGYLYKKADKIDEAKRLLLKAISISEKCGDCYTHLGEIYFEETQCSKAAGLFRRALDTQGYNEEVMMKLGRALVLSYRNEAALEVFGKVFQKNPKHHEAFYRLSHIYLLWHDVEKVTTLIAQRKNTQKTVWDHLVQGDLLELQNNIEAALISYSVALRLQPDMAEALAGKGRIDLIQGKFNNAVVNFSKALVKDPYNPYLLLNLGKAYEGIGQFSSAFDVYSDVADKYSQIPETYSLIAGIRSREKKHKGAVEIVQKGLKHNPQNSDLYSVLGREYFILGDFDRSLEAYKNAIKYGSDKPIEAYLSIANIYFNKLKNEKEAKKYLKKYLKKGGSKKDFQKHNLASLDI